MPIYYSLISRGRVVVCDYSAGANLENLSLQALDNLGPSDVTLCQTIGSLQVFTLVDSGLTYLCVTDLEFDRADGIKHLRSVAQSLRSQGLHARAKSNLCGPYSLRTDFQETMERLAIEAGGDRFAELHSKVGNVKNMMKENIRKVTERGESLVDLEDRSEVLAANSTDFHRSAVRLRKKMFWKSVKTWVILIIVLLIVLLIIVAVIIGGLMASGKIKT